jgi:ArgJ family
MLSSASQFAPPTISLHCLPPHRVFLQWAAVFTKNMFPGAPVIVGRERLASGAPLQAIVINNKISNVCPGGEPGAGVRDSKIVCDKVADIWSLAGGGSAVLPCSTGVIGWRLPVQVRSRGKCIAVSFAYCNCIVHVSAHSSESLCACYETRLNLYTPTKRLDHVASGDSIPSVISECSTLQLCCASSMKEHFSIACMHDFV